MKYQYSDKWGGLSGRRSKDVSKIRPIQNKWRGLGKSGEVGRDTSPWCNYSKVRTSRGPLVSLPLLIGVPQITERKERRLGGPETESNDEESSVVRDGLKEENPRLLTREQNRKTHIFVEEVTINVSSDRIGYKRNIRKYLGWIPFFSFGRF